MKKNLFFLATALLAVIMMFSANTANASDSVDDVRSFDKSFNGIILNGNATVYVLQSPTR